MDVTQLAGRVAALLPRRLCYWDVGGRWGLAEPWAWFDEALRVVAFEPDAEEYRRLLAAGKPKDVILNRAVWRESGRVPFHLARARGCSSIYEPNREFLEKFADARRYDVEKTVEVETGTIDALAAGEAELADLDFLKIDVQGAELDVLRGGEAFLAGNALGIEVEVEFQPLYRGQPLFSDVDKFVRERIGLELQDLRKTYWKRPEGIGLGALKGQLIFGDALYFRPPEAVAAAFAGAPPDRARAKVAAALLMGLVYGYLDYTLAVLALAERERVLPQDQVRLWRETCAAYGRCLRCDRGRVADKLARLFHLLYRVFQPSHQGWATLGDPLGSRKRFGIFH